MRHWLSLFAFMLIVVSVGALIGIQTAPGNWYAQLDKPPFNPPNWIFAPVWSVLYIFIAIAGWRIWIADRGSVAMKLWGFQMALNWLWSPVFFTLHWLWPALVIITAILASIVAFIAITWRRDRIASTLFVPYMFWVGFATLLNGAIAILN